MIPEKHIHLIDSAISYCTSGFLCGIGTYLVESKDLISALTIFVGLLIGIVRLAIDVRVWWRGRKKK